MVPLQERGGLSEAPVGCLTLGPGDRCRVTSLTQPASANGRLPDGPDLYAPTGLGPVRGPWHPMSPGAGLSRPLLLHQRTRQVTGTSTLLGQGAPSRMLGGRGQTPQGPPVPLCTALDPVSGGLTCRGGTGPHIPPLPLVRVNHWRLTEASGRG